MHLIYRQAVFLTGAVRGAQFPPDDGAEVAFAGRSNAGKSSAINAITGIKSLARTSKTPGRTRQINFFRLDEERRLVDLPGFGYARVPTAVRNQWVATVEEYLHTRRCLRGIILIMDVRHPLTELDLRLIDWCQFAGMPVHTLLTKSDKLSRGRATAALAETRRRLAARKGCHAKAEVPPPYIQLFSATTAVKGHVQAANIGSTGVDEARSRLDQWLGL